MKKIVKTKCYHGSVFNFLCQNCGQKMEYEETPSMVGARILPDEIVGYNSKEDILNANKLLKCEHKRRDITCEYCNVAFTQKCRRDALEQKISQLCNSPEGHSQNCAIRKLPGNECSCDGYHTFDELYEHRIRLWITLCRYFIQGKASYDSRNVWMSKLHSDGSSFDGWFIMGIAKEKGNQITYHLPIKYWEECEKTAEVLEQAPEFDGHTSDDVLERIKKL